MKTVTILNKEYECKEVKRLRVLQFLEKVEIPSLESCWLWKGYVNDRGYGMVSFGSKPTQAYRFSWLAFHGPLLDSRHLHHTCENKLCVNPDHLADISPRAHQGQHHHKEVPATYFDGSTCKNGHPRTVENTYIWEGQPSCRRCHADNTNRYYHETKGLSQHKSEWTHCVNGHEFTPENTYIRKATTRRAEARRCKTCMLAEQKEAYHRNRDKRLAKQKLYYENNKVAILDKKLQRTRATITPGTPPSHESPASPSTS